MKCVGPILLELRLLQGDCPIVTALCLGRPAVRAYHVAKVGEGDREAIAEDGDGGVVVGQLLLDRQRLATLGLRLPWLAHLQQHLAYIRMVPARHCWGRR